MRITSHSPRPSCLMTICVICPLPPRPPPALSGADMNDVVDEWYDARPDEPDSLKVVVTNGPDGLLEVMAGTEASQNKANAGESGEEEALTNRLPDIRRWDIIVQQPLCASTVAKISKLTPDPSSRFGTCRKLNFVLET